MPSSGGSHRAINGALLARQDCAWCFRHSTCSCHPLLARKCRCIYYWFGEVAIHIKNYTYTIQYTGCTCISWRTYILIAWHVCRACPRRSQRTAAVAMRIHKVNNKEENSAIYVVTYGHIYAHSSWSMPAHDRWCARHDVHIVMIVEIVCSRQALRWSLISLWIRWDKASLIATSITRLAGSPSFL